ncbi:hypothetical protein VNO77_00404 [Canavalia gladiata]|uniref:Uncharacterized protein n=1 Tax=Canavalia gladiata TaxID=3824 RepID=A0AAN9R4C9_CANGL
MLIACECLVIHPPRGFNFLYSFNFLYTAIESAMYSNYLNECLFFIQGVQMFNISKSFIFFSSQYISSCLEIFSALP